MLGPTCSHLFLFIFLAISSEGSFLSFNHFDSISPTSCSSSTGPWCWGHSTSSAVTASCWRYFSLKQCGVMVTGGRCVCVCVCVRGGGGGGVGVVICGIGEG